MASNLLFSREATSNDDNDVWDDTALIRAYDKAVNKIKTDLSKPSEKKSHKTEKSRKREVTSSQSKKEERTVSKWKIGDHCVAVYSEDSISYPAVIIAINEEDQTCRIRYDVYENEEDKALNELFEPIVESDAEKKEIKSSKKPKVYKQENSKPFDFPIPPPPPPLPASLMSHFNSLSINENESGEQSDDKEAFYSMLMSWYMSGYHTGYYFGLTQKQFQNANIN